MRRLFLMTLCLLMTAGLFAQRGTCGTGISWKLTDGTLTVSGSGVMTDFSGSTPPSWNVYKDDITDVVIETGVTHVGAYAFVDYPNLRTVRFAEGVESIGRYAFERCAGITELTLPESLQTINYGAFDGISISELTVPAGLQSISGGTFSSCSKLTLVNWNAVNCSISDTYSPFCGSRMDFTGDPITEVRFGDKVERIPASLFNSCVALETIKTSGTISRVGAYAFNKTKWLNNQPDGTLVYIDKALYTYWGTMTKATTIVVPEGVESITDFAFRNSKYLVGISVPGTMKSIGDDAFDGCTDLGRVVWNAVECEGFTKAPFEDAAIYEVEFGDRVQNIPDYMFDMCDGLETVDFPASLQSIGRDAFWGCDLIEELDLPVSLRFIGESAFRNCERLKRVVIPENVVRIDGMAFASNPALKDVEFNAINCQSARSTRGLSFAPFVYTDLETFTIGEKVTYIPDMICSGKGRLTTLVIPNSVKTIGNNAFSDCSGLTAITVGENVETIESGAFSGCTGVKELTWNAVAMDDVEYSRDRYIPSTVIETLTLGEKVRNIPAFLCYGCSNLADFTIPASVETIGVSAFCDCSSLTKIVLPNTVRVVAQNAFSGCTNVKTAEIGEGVTTISSLSTCRELTSVKWNAIRCEDATSGIMPKSLVDITFGDKVETIPGYLCNAVLNLTQVEFPKSVKRIGPWAFGGCTGLSNVELPGSLTELGEKVFYRCSALKSVTLPATLKTIPQFAFGMTGLEHMYIPGTVEEIQSNAFSGNKELKNVIVASDVVVPMSSSFGGCTALASILVPDADAYKTADGWSVYADKINPMVSFSDYSFVYTGQSPRPEYMNNVPGYGGRLEMVDLAVDAGEYTVRMRAEFIGDNTFSVHIPYTYTIGKALLTIIPETVEKVYGDKEPQIPYTVEGLVNGETLETAVEVMPRLMACTTETSAVGSYMIVYNNEPVAKNYGFLFREAYVRVVPRQLLVSVEKSTRRYGEKNPDFTLTYDGFVNDEDTTVLDWMPYVECDAYPWSPVGEYEVVVSGGHATNYTFVYTNGVLQVEKGLQEIIWEQELTELRVGDTVNLFAWATSDLPVTFETDTPDLCTIENGDYGYVLMCHAAGTVHIRAMQAGNENWEVAEPVDRELEISTSTDIAGHGANRITVDTDSRNIIVRGAAEGMPVRVYTLNGVRLYDELSRGEELRFAIDGSAVYIVHVGPDSFKVMAGRR